MVRTLFVIFLTLPVFCQPSQRPLSIRDADAWRSIQSATLSRDGRFLAYGLFPQEGDGEVVVRDIKTGAEHRAGAGAIPAPPERDESEPAEQRQSPRNVRIAFTSDSRYVLFSAYPPKADVDQAKKQKKKPDEMPKNSLVTIDVSSGKATRIPSVKSFQVPRLGGAVVAYLKEAEPAAKADGSKSVDDSKSSARSGEARKEYGTELVLLDLKNAEPAERRFSSVLEYSLSRDGETLVYAVSSRKEEENGLYTLAADAADAPVALLTGKGKYSKLTWDLRQTQLAFLSDRDDVAARHPKAKLYWWDRKAAAASEIVSVATPGFRSGFVLSERGPLGFSRDGARIFLSCAPQRPTAPDDSGDADEKVVADLWHWRDGYIQPMQKVRARTERERSYRAVYEIAARRFLQLADETMAQLNPSDDGRFAIGWDDRAYRHMVDYDALYADYYLLDTASGNRRKLIEKARAGSSSAPAWSPDGRHAIFYRDRHWYSLSAEGTIVNLTAAIQANFYNEDDDRPEPPNAHGTAGWLRDGSAALLYDRFDVWRVSPDGKTAVNVTGGVGRRQNVRFRVVRTEPDEEDEPRGFDPSKPLLLRAQSLANYDTGFWSVPADGAAPPRKLLMDSRNFAFSTKAREADVLLIAASRFDQAPDLHVTDITFKQLRKVTDLDAQRAPFLWGTEELVQFKNSDGVPLKAQLIKPANFDPKKKYPLMVYIYERRSQTLHDFVEPRPGTSINVSIFVSNGYLVLQPDIVYTLGYPGQSALKCVLPAIQEVVDRGFVDENAIGIQGHSWGGYQVAYLVGRTNRFRAAEAGAPVANMISAYNGIRWGSGLPRQFQYEKTQSRIGGTLWEQPLRFLENSPLFSADRITTPLLILHNDQDDAVPWYQGIELYLSLRRLGKEVYLFSYNGEKHGIRKRPNQKDYSQRMLQFFDHHLKGAPQPEWMERGIPYLEREEEKRKFLPAK